MKNSLLTFFGLATLGSAVAQQTPSPSWTISQNASFSITSAGVRFLDAVDQNTVWLLGYDGTAPGLDYNWWSKTTNGGATYTSGNVYADTNTYVPANMEGIDGNVAWVASYLKASQDRGAIHKTTDGGATWTNMAAPNMFSVAGTSFVDFVSFLTPSVGIALGDPINNDFEIYRTNNAGTSWTAVPGANIPNPLSGEYGLVNIYTKMGTTNYWYGTNKNRVYRSTDAGLTWSVSAQLTATAIGAVLGINDIAFIDPMNGFLEAYFGPTGNGTLTVWNTTDGGATWNMIPTVDANYGRNGVCGIPGTSWYASAGAGNGNNIISFSMDNGVTWNSWGGANIQYLNVDFVSPTAGWAGSFSSPTLATQDGIYKYSGPSLLQPASANFTVSSAGCVSVGLQVGNSSTGNPWPTYSWSVTPAAAINNSTATNPIFTFTNTGTYTITVAATNPSNTSTATRTVAVGLCTGIHENALSAQNINLYPNPASDMLNIELPAVNAFSYQIADVLGKSVINGVVNDSRASINTSSLGKGIYFITVQSEGQKATKKIIIE
jgi:photosystem II stability/assembly factor-like uncharacterized protein